MFFKKSQPEPTEIKEETPKAPVFKKKRDIFRFQGEKDISINLEHVTNMYLEGKRVTFQFYSTSTFIDFEDEAAGKTAYEQLLGVWSVET